MFTAIVAAIVLLIIDHFARLYRRASAEQAFVRTASLAGKSGDERRRYCDANFHEIIPINMNTPKSWKSAVLPSTA